MRELFAPGRSSVEVGEVPLCANCAVEAEVDELDDGGVLQRGLRRVDAVDGGTTRKRWESRGKTGVVLELQGRVRQHQKKQQPKQQGHRFGADGTETEILANLAMDCTVPVDSTI